MFRSGVVKFRIMSFLMTFYCYACLCRNEKKKKHSLKCLKIEVDVLCMFLILTLRVFLHLDVSSSAITSPLWATTDCCPSKLPSKMTLRRHRVAYALPRDMKTCHVDSAEVFSFEIEMNLRLIQAVACMY